VLQFAPVQYTARIQTLWEMIPGIGPESVSDAAFQGRSLEIQTALRTFLDNPLFGVGLRNARLTYQPYAIQMGYTPESVSRPPHSLFLEIAAEMGIAGLLAFGILIWIVVRGMLRSRRMLSAAGRTDLVPLIFAIEGALLAYLVSGVTGHMAAYPRYFWLLMGLAIAVPTVVRNELPAHSETDHDD
jgi:putative inorganic carbon (hco3(-)) transporter